MDDSATASLDPGYGGKQIPPHSTFATTASRLMPWLR
jgi:hypothetical protein